jgi:hypothetical protein|tara:strand:+ start:442 stop:576 length:135 start_codon:yes stop_codon:yes gene_type:complete
VGLVVVVLLVQYLTEMELIILVVVEQEQVVQGLQVQVELVVQEL